MSLGAHRNVPKERRSNEEIRPKSAASGLKSTEIDGQAGTPVAAAPRLQFDRYILDIERGHLLADDQEITLRPKTFDFLRYLAGNAGRLVSKDELLAAVWPGVCVGDDSLVQCVSEIRRALDDHTQRLLRTVPRRGYRFEAVVSQVPRTARSAHLASWAPANWGGPDSLLGRVWPTLAVCRVAITAGLVTVALIVGLAVWWSFSQSQIATDRPALSIVVVPFRNLSNDPKQDYFSRGVSDDLTIELSRLPGLVVIANATAQTLRKKSFDARAIGRDLKVRYLLDGSVRRTGDRVRISAELIDAETSATLWADRFDREHDQLGLWQDGIIGRIANTLNYQLTRLAGERGRRAQGANPVASDLSTRAWALIYTAKKPKTYASARTLFRQALLLDPEAVNALAGIGWTSAVMVLDGWSVAPSKDIAAADAAVSKALTLDPNHVIAHHVRGFLLRMQRRTEAARDAFQTAISINPNFAPGYAQLGATELEIGRPDAAILAVKHAMRLSPMDPSLGPWLAFLGMSELHLGHYREAATWLRRAIETGTPVARHRAYLASALALTGSVSEAHNALARFRAAQPSATIASLRAGAKSTEAEFLRQQEVFLKGLRIAGLPE